MKYMNAMKTITIVVACGFALVASAAEIVRTTVRQRWPFSQTIDVDYVLSCDPSEEYDLTPVLYSGGERLNIDGCSVGGDRHNISDGAHSLSIDLGDSSLGNSGKISALSVELNIAESPLYMIVDIRKNGADESRVTYLTRSDIVSGAYGTYETDMSKFGVDKCRLEDPIVWTGVTNDTKYLTTHMVFRRIRRGSFAVKGAAADNVFVTRPYWLSVFEWTSGYRHSVEGTGNYAEETKVRPQWNCSTKWMRGSTNETIGVNWPETGYGKVDGVIKVLRDTTGLYFDLPTEAQWELACRAGTATEYARGAGESTSYSNAVADVTCRYKYNGGWGYNANGEFKWMANESSFARCGSYAPNAYGLYDMLGNVGEVCLDWYVTADSSTHIGFDPRGPKMDTASIRKRVARGGAAWNDANGTVVSGRSQAGHDETSSLYGFRLAIVLDSAH